MQEPTCEVCRIAMGFPELHRQYIELSKTQNETTKRKWPKTGQSEITKTSEMAETNKKETTETNSSETTGRTKTNPEK